MSMNSIVAFWQRRCGLNSVMELWQFIVLVVGVGGALVGYFAEEGLARVGNIVASVATVVFIVLWILFALRRRNGP